MLPVFVFYGYCGCVALLCISKIYLAIFKVIIQAFCFLKYYLRPTLNQYFIVKIIDIPKLIAAIFCFPISVSAQNFQMVKDINEFTDASPVNTFNAPDGSVKKQYAVLNNIAYFSASDNDNRNKLWRSDGTQAGTYIFKDIAVSSITKAGNSLYFLSTDSTGYVLYSTDGTQPGTSLIRRFGYNSPENLVQISEKLFFSVFTVEGKVELWNSDGTENGTTLIKQIPNYFYADITGITDVNGKAFFLNLSYDSSGGVWMSDGTEDGTKQVYNTSVGGNHCAANGKFFFEVKNFYSYLYVTDGTQNGTQSLSEVYFPHNFVSLNNVIYFTGSDGYHGQELWRSDGTAGGTFVLKDIRPGIDSSAPHNEVVVNGKVYFDVVNALGNRDLWKTDGTSEGTVLVKTFGNSTLVSPYGLTEINNALFFGGYTSDNGAELWKSDGTNEGTVLVKDIFTGSSNSYPSYLTNLDGNIIFSTNDGINGNELWFSDGTSTNTQLIKNINTINTFGSVVGFQLFPFKDKVYFNAYTPQYTFLGYYGTLWGTDGSAVNTNRITGTKTDAEVTNLYTNLYASNNRIYFNALDNHYNIQLWSTDGISSSFIKNVGNESGANSLNDNFQLNGADLPYPFCSVNNNTYFFTAQNLWKINENDNTTILIKNGYRGGLATDSNYIYFTAANNELWKTDGTPNGTIKIENAHPQYKSDVSQIISFDKKIYFRSNDNKLWKTDGTEEETKLLKDIKPYFTDENFKEKGLSAVANNILFFCGQNQENGQELWKTDGTEAGTKLVKDIFPGPSSAIVSGLYGNMVGLNNSLYFIANDGVHGTELWKTDGTEAGTSLLKDITPGAQSSYIVSLTKVGNKLAFLLYDNSARKYVIWQSDGTIEGTFAVSDDNLNDVTIAPQGVWGVFGFNNKLYFRGITAKYGAELWAGSLETTLPISLLHFSAKLINKDALLTWTTTNEQNFNHFNLQRSIDGINFSIIATINAKDNSNSKTDYDYSDKNIVSLGSNKIYYRLEQVDKDGKKILSKIVLLELSNNGITVSLRPNPVHTNFELQVNNLLDNQYLQISIVNTQGKVLLSESRAINTGSNTLIFNSSSWPVGLYILRINMKDGTTKEIKFIKQ